MTLLIVFLAYLLGVAVGFERGKRTKSLDIEFLERVRDELFKVGKN